MYVGERGILVQTHHSKNSMHIAHAAKTSVSFMKHHLTRKAAAGILATTAIVGTSLVTAATKPSTQSLDKSVQSKTTIDTEISQQAPDRTKDSSHRVTSTLRPLPPGRSFLHLYIDSTHILQNVNNVRRLVLP